MSEPTLPLSWDYLLCDIESSRAEPIEKVKEVWRIVNSQGEQHKFNNHGKKVSPFYSTLLGANRALCHYDHGSRIQYGEVNWVELA